MKIASRAGARGAPPAARAVALSAITVVGLSGALSGLAPPFVAGLAGCRKAGTPPAGSRRDGADALLALPAATSTLRGRVNDERGGPVPGARVLAFAPDAPGAPGPREATADADGRFALDRLGPGTYRLLVEAPGFASAEVAAPALPGPQAGPAVEIRLPGEARAIAGRVFAAGAPAGGARVLLAHGSGMPVREALARDDGTFVFAGLGPGDYSLRATRGAFASAVVGGVTVGDPAAPAPPRREPGGVRLDLGPGAFVDGRVLDDTGAVVPGASVRVEPTAGEGPPDVVPAERDGRFRAGPVAPGEYRLIPRRDGYVSQRLVTARLDPASPVPSQKLELVRGAAIAGRVVDGSGRPVSAATVRCVAAGIEDLVVLFEPLPAAAEAAALPAGAGRALGATRSVRSGADGRFEIADLLPGRFRLEVSRPAAIPFRTDELALAPGERRDAGTLALQEGLEIAGRVSDDQGLPVNGAHVAVRRRTGPTAAAVDVGLYAVTDGDGRFALALAPGPYTLGVTAPNLTDQAVAIEVAPGAPAPAAVEVKLARADGTLEGIARDEGGRPLAHARVTAWPPGEAPGRPAPDAAPFASAVADAGGHFVLARVPRRALLVEVRHPDYPAATETAVPGKLVAVTAAIPGGVAGEVREQGSGAPIARFRVEATGPDGRKADAARGKQGAFTITRLQPGHWRLVASAPGFLAAERDVEVPRSPALGEPSVRDLRLELRRSSGR